MVLDKVKRILSSPQEETDEEEYVELDLEDQEQKNDKKVRVKLFILEQYDDVNNILNALREGYTIAMIDFKALKQKDPVELKRAVSKIKKTVGALEGHIAGHENMVIATPSFAKIYKEDKNKGTKKGSQQNSGEDDKSGASGLETY